MRYALRLAYTIVLAKDFGRTRRLLCPASTGERGNQRRLAERRRPEQNSPACFWLEVLGSSFRAGEKKKMSKLDPNLELRVWLAAHHPGMTMSIP